MITFPARDRQLGDEIVNMYGRKAKNVTFIVTNACNMACTYCYQHHKQPRAMSFETARKFVDMLFELDAANHPLINAESAHCLILDFIGGEPLLEIDLMDQIMDYFLAEALRRKHRWALHHYISISTNGLEYFNPKVEQFIRKHDGRISMSITIDGNKKLHDTCRVTVDGQPTYDRAAAAFRDTITRFNQHGTKLTIARANLPYLYEACRDMIEKFDLRYLQGNPVFEEEWNNDDAALYYKQLKMLAGWLIESGRWETTWVSFFDDFIGQPLNPEDNQNFCGGTGEMLALDVDGKIYPCLRYAPLSAGSDMASRFVLGDVENGFIVTDEQRKCIDCLSCITRRSQSTDECFNCPIGSGCAWCSAWNCELYGTPNKRCTNICAMHKARVMACAYYFNSIYRVHNEPDRFHLNIPADWAIPIVGQEEFELLLRERGCDSICKSE